ncbi:MAG: hypothetical protein ACK5O1_01210 [Holosporales bacterium]|jgi:hypothetical protein
MISKEIFNTISQLRVEEVVCLRQLLSHCLEKGESLSDSDIQTLTEFGLNMKELNFFKLFELREILGYPAIELLIRSKLASNGKLDVEEFLSNNRVHPKALWRALASLQEQGENLTISTISIS